jgi:hypothetical protein
VYFGLAALSFAVLVATLVSKDWIEAVSGLRPDRNGGSDEWLVALLGAVGTVVFTGLARPSVGRLAWNRVLECAECGAKSEGDAVGWRAGFVSADEAEAEVIVFCPDCFAREFQSG